MKYFAIFNRNIGNIPDTFLQYSVLHEQDTLSNYLRRKCGFEASWDDEDIDCLIDWRIANINLEITFYFVDAVRIVK